MPALLAGDVVPAVVETSYTPALTASTSNPTLGSGSVVQGRYYVDYAGIVHVNVRITFGTSGTAAGTGEYRISLPVSVDNLSSGTTLGTADIIGWGIVRDNSSATTGSRTVVAYRQSATTVQLAVLDGTNGNVGAAVPFAWSTEDSISLQLVYPAA